METGILATGVINLLTNWAESFGLEGRVVLKFTPQGQETIECKTAMLPAESYLVRLSSRGYRVTRVVVGSPEVLSL